MAMGDIQPLAPRSAVFAGIVLTILSIAGILFLAGSGSSVGVGLGYLATGPFSAYFWQNGSFGQAATAATVGALVIYAAAMGILPLFDLKPMHRLWLSGVFYLLYWEFWGLVWLGVGV